LLAAWSAELRRGGEPGLVEREIAIRAVPPPADLERPRRACAAAPVEARAVVLGDPRYASAWTDLAVKLAADLERLGGYARRWERLPERGERRVRRISRVVAEEHEC